MNFRTIPALLAVGLLAPASAEKLNVDLVVPELIKDRLAAGVVGARQRQAAIQRLFNDAGCTTEDQPINKGTANVICTLPGQAASTIVVGGHFDFADEGKGIVDDWSGASLLASLYQALQGRPRKHTYVFVAFAAEERGLVGSSRYVARLTPEQRAATRAFINLECLGLAATKVWVSRSTPALVARLAEVGQAIGAAVEGVNVDQVGDDDTHPFLQAGIPVISIHSVTQDTWPILHSPRDRVDAIHFDDYYNSYKLAAYYLAYLDAKAD